MTIPQLLDRTVARHGSRDAAVFVAQNQRLSWYDLKQQADNMAAALLSLGIRRGNRVGIWSPNRLEWLLTQFATARIGAVLVNINPAYKSSELEYALNKVRCRMLVMARGHKNNNYLDTLRQLAPEIDRPGQAGELTSLRLEHLKHVIVLDELSLPAHEAAKLPVSPRAMRFKDFLQQAGPAQHARLKDLSAALDPDDAINIQFTSGTTGHPKGATLSHFNIVNNARFAAKSMALTREDRMCIPVPLYHCFGMVLGVLTCTATGAAMVFPGQGFDAGATLKAVVKQRCTALHGVPTMFVAMLAEPAVAQMDFSLLRTGIMAGAPCPVETMQAVMRTLNMKQVTIGYGMTETSPLSFQSHVSDPVERRVATVGRIQPHVQAKVVDGHGRMVPVGTPGELCVRGYLVMRAYWEDPQQTSGAIDEAGWMHTGDLATIDAQGYCNIVGRVKDMLIRGGENVFPREIENFLMQHPKVLDVQVFGVPDAKYGEEIAVWVILQPGQSAEPQELVDFCRTSLAHYKTPRYVRLVREFPLTATGKPQKFQMRQSMVNELGLRSAQTA
ncbi:MAG: AMP-binding protein [Limnohabitans sp.]|nr:AMP-binding protein [Limnohabitans sp.]